MLWRDVTCQMTVQIVTRARRIHDVASRSPRPVSLRLPSQDVKPANVLVSTGKRFVAKVADFGLARRGEHSLPSGILLPPGVRINDTCRRRISPSGHFTVTVGRPPLARGPYH